MAWDYWHMTTDEALGAPAGYRSRIRHEGRLAWPTIVALVAGGLTFLSEALLGWWTNWVDVGGWQASAFTYPFTFLPLGIVVTILFAVIAGAGFGLKNRLGGIVAGLLPLVGIVAMALVAAIPGASPLD